LTLSLLLLFTGLTVVSLNTLNQHSTLTEGAVRFETLLRFARAQAEHTGKRVRISFVQDTNPPPVTSQLSTNQAEPPQLSHVELTWEPDPVGEPDVFQDLLTSQWGLDQVNDTVGVSAVRLVDNAEPQPAADDPDEPAPDAMNCEDATAAPPTSITFNPNGSCDSADITLADREGKEAQLVTVRIEGFTGCVWRLNPPEAETDATPAAQPSSDLPGPPGSGQFN